MPAAGSTDPLEIIVDRQARVLIIAWKDGHRSLFPFDDLRRECPCASCEEARGKREAAGGRPLVVLTGPVLRRGEAQVTDYRPVGWYALNFTWNDGHDTGIYTYEFLRAHCRCPACLGTVASR